MPKNNLHELNNINLDSIAAILLDVDDTLYDYKQTHEDTIKHFYKQTYLFWSKNSIEAQDDFIEKYIYARNMVKQEHPSNALTRSRYLAFFKLLTSLDINENLYNLALSYENLYWHIFIEKMPVLEPYWDHFFKKCAERKINICVVTDMQTRFQVRKLQKLNVSNYIKLMVTSEDVNVEKPSSVIFNKAFTLLKTDPKNVLMLGDSLSKDIEGAENVGCRAIRIGYNLN